VDDLARWLVQLNRSIRAAMIRSVEPGQAPARGQQRSHRQADEAFDRYAENIAETNSKAFVSALSEVVRDSTRRS